MIFKKELDCTHLNRDGIISMQLFWDAEVAVFRTEYKARGEKKTAFNIANPTDWHWLTSGGADGSVIQKNEAEGVIAELENAKRLWAKVRVIARMLGLKWLDKSYVKVSRMEYTDVFIRHTNAPFVPTQHCGAQVLPAGELIINLVSAGNDKFVQDAFHMAIKAESGAAFIDLRQDRSDIEIFLKQPHVFDGDAAKTTLSHKGTAFRASKEGVVLVDEDRYEIEIETNRYGYLKYPRFEMRCPYALLYKFREDVARIKYLNNN